MSVRELVTDIEIAAPVERVWETLVDVAAYPEWNPYLRRISGTLTPGSPLEIEVHRGNGKNRVFTVRLTAQQEGRRLAWRSALLASGLLTIEHVFELLPLGDGRVRLVQREAFRGLLAPLGGRSLDHARASFEAMNLALKDRAERGPA